MTQRQAIVLYGAGGHGKVVADMIEKEGKYRIAGFVDDEQSGTAFGYEILGTGDSIPSLITRGITTAIVTIGPNDVRLRLQENLQRAGMTIATIVHPSAQIARGVVLGQGTVIMPGTIIGPDAHIGPGCIINTGATVDHDCTIGAGVHIAPGAHLAGGVEIGDTTHIGIGSAVKEGVNIGSDTIVGAGSVVLEHLPDRCIAYGVPAKPMRKNKE